MTDLKKFFEGMFGSAQNRQAKKTKKILAICKKTIRQQLIKVASRVNLSKPYEKVPLGISF